MSLSTCPVATTSQLASSGAAAPQTMRAVEQPAYAADSGILRLAERPVPTPQDGEVLVRVHAVSLAKGDVHLLTGTPYLVRLMFGLKRPKEPVVGQDFAGTVAAIGEGATRFAVGDRVFGAIERGACQDYIRVPAETLAHIPEGVSDADAAAVPTSALTALQGLRDTGQLKAGQRVLINGASGGVGTYAVQIAKILGAHVTAVCSTRHVDNVRALGADEVIDYTKADFRALEERFDVLLDMVGNHRAGKLLHLLTPRGRLVVGGGGEMGNWIGPIAWMAGLAIRNTFTRRTVKNFLQQGSVDDLVWVGEQMRAGALRPVVEQVLEMEQTAEGLRHIQAGHARGKTVIRLRA